MADTTHSEGAQNTPSASGSASPESSPQKEKAKPASKNRDPSRPKRKKARRACAACQRAHLTCGDERPCERCIKRGLADDCHDGARKKAKYLRDAPDEALQPGAGRFFKQSQSAESPPNATNMPHPGVHNNNGPPTDGGFMENSQPQLSGYGTNPGGTRQPSRGQQEPGMYNPFAGQPTPIQAPPFNRPSPMQTMNNNAYPTLDGQNFLNAFSDPADQTLLGFDPSSVNFGNQYGAAEFGMLGQMTSGAHNTPVPRGSSGVGAGGFGNPSNDMNFSFNGQSAGGDWQAHDIRMNTWGSQNGLDNMSEGRSEPNTYAIGNASNPYMGASPGSSTTDFIAPFETTSPDLTYSTTLRNQAARQLHHPDPQIKQEREHRPSKDVSKKLESLPPAKTTAQRRHNAARIYASVIKPYPYTARFHALIAVISRRFKANKRLRIAKALGSIRPSFISCTRTLIEEDLILMEKNFQRSLLEYRDHVSSCGTPTIICRRTGEVAYCGESFLLLSGWPVGVLLGKEPNLNINRGADDGEAPPSGTMTGSSRGGYTTPQRLTTAGVDPNSAVPHPVFLTDLLDDDSVVHFYEDFAKIAFADSKGSATRPCKLLKYKTKDDPLFSRNRFEGESGNGERRQQQKGSRQAGGPQQDISRLGEDDGTVDCIFCWTVKRDVFEFPMMVVINFLPILTT